MMVPVLPTSANGKKIKHEILHRVNIIHSNIKGYKQTKVKRVALAMTAKSYMG
jgi:hypothetical protein